MPKSLYLKKAILDGYIGGTALPAIPSVLYIALFTTNPTADSDVGTEVSGGSYARKLQTNNSSNFPNATQASGSPALKKNAFNLPWPTATAGWGTITGFGIYNASSGGNLLYWGTVTPNVSVASGDTFRADAGNIQITEN